MESVCLLRLQMKEVNITTTKASIVLSWWQFQITSSVFRTLKLGKRFRIGWVFQNCSLLELLENGLLPTRSFLVGDDAFPLNPYLMKAYKNHNRPLMQEESIFHYRLSRASRIIEKVFGILVSRFRFLDRKLAVKLGTVNKLASAACALHNWLVITSKATYFSGGAID